MKRSVAATTAVLALAAPSVAAGAIKTYGGKIDDGGKIGIDVDLAGGDPAEITELRFKRFPATCSVTGPSLLTGTVAFTGFSLPTNHFLFDDDVDANGSHLYFEGGFRKDARRIVGEIKDKAVFTADPGPAQTCTTKKRDYTAERGAPGAKAPAHTVVSAR